LNSNIGKEFNLEGIDVGGDLPHKAPAITGAFYFFNHSHSPQNAIQYMAPLPTSTADFEPL